MQLRRESGDLSCLYRQICQNKIEIPWGRWYGGQECPPHRLGTSPRVFSEGGCAERMADKSVRPTKRVRPAAHRMFIRSEGRLEREPDSKDSGQECPPWEFCAGHVTLFERLKIQMLVLRVSVWCQRKADKIIASGESK